VKKLMKNAVLFLLCALLAIGFAACDKTPGPTPQGNTQNPENTPISYTETLRVYNASEYMDLATIADFEREYAIKVEYSEFDSNEDMYADITANPRAYDVLVPSDYMADRLIKEGKLASLDKSLVSNLSNVAEEYLSPAYDPGNDYIVPYMVGTLGILYNKTQVTGPIESWNALFAPQYSGRVLMLDSQRDSIGLTLKMLGFSLNSSDEVELAQVQEKLRTLRGSAVYNESESIRDKMVAGEGVLGVVYSGDAKTAIDRNPSLAYAIPQEGSNKWVDGFVILKDSEHKDAAQKFIDFMCRPNIAVRNMSAIGYTSPIKGAWGEFGGNTIMFPSAEVLASCDAFLFDAQAAEKYGRLWTAVV